jgi:hypothetical protein
VRLCPIGLFRFMIGIELCVEPMIITGINYNLLKYKFGWSVNSLSCVRKCKRIFYIWYDFLNY